MGLDDIRQGVQIKSNEFSYDILDSPFKHAVFNNFLSSDDLENLTSYASKYVPTNRIGGYRTASNDTRTFLNRETLPDYAAKFSASDLKSYIGSIVDRDLSYSFTRVELISDEVGTIIKPHVDHQEKLVTWMLYLRGHSNDGTELLGADHAIVSKVPLNANGGYLFSNRKTAFHGLASPTREIRLSIIINYVNEEWRTVSELTGCD